MINLEYVNGSISLETDSVIRPFESFMESCKTEIDNMFVDFDVLSERVALESAIMDTVPDDMMMVYESEKSNIFAKIGEIIIAIYEKIVKLIDDVIDKIKSISLKKKTDSQKLDLLIKKHPDLKNEAIAAFNSGALEMKDINSLKELEETFDEVIKMSRKAEADPKSIKAKWEKAKEKFEKSEKTWKVVAAVAGAATAIVTAGVAIKTLAPKCAEATNKLNDERRKAKEEEAEALASIKRLKDHRTDDGSKVVNDNMSRFHVELQIRREMNQKRSAVIGNRLTLIERISDGIAKLVDKIDKDGGKRLIDDLTEVAKQKKNREDAELDKEIKKAEKLAEARKS